MMPTVTVRSRPNGLPMAMAHWPTRSRSESPSSATGSGRRPCLDLEHREVGLRVAAHERRLELAVVGEAHLDLGRVLDHVVVGQDVAARVHDDAGAARPRPSSRGARRRKKRSKSSGPKNSRKRCLHLRRRAALRPGSHASPSRSRSPPRAWRDPRRTRTRLPARAGAASSPARGPGATAGRAAAAAPAPAARARPGPRGAAGRRRRDTGSSWAASASTSYRPIRRTATRRPRGSSASSRTRVVAAVTGAIEPRRMPATQMISPPASMSGVRATLPSRNARVDQERLEPPQRGRAERREDVAAAAGAHRQRRRQRVGVEGGAAALPRDRVVAGARDDARR